ncbi:hypothetical protein LCGC14_1013150 [marine sediment metagenome]|uniref:DNA (cytosine-5-)-methyltransferase n=1 Tax=marine sediment metagenome TaxID=412755 RepID=A0A0F9QI28_9ZZZZ
MRTRYPLKELSLFTGAGGGILGSKLLGWRLVGCVEWDDYCQRVLRQRMEDNLIERAPIFSDIRAFINEEYAKAYQDMVDIITAGFPCQPFSIAGKNKGEDDPRNMWPATIECIRIIRPTLVFLENVPNLLYHSYIRTIFRDLAESGYDVRWRVLSAREVGAPIERKRLWILGSNKRKHVQIQIHKRTTIKVKFWDDEIRTGLQNVKTSWLMAHNFVDSNSNGLAKGLDEVRAIGNGQVPCQMARAWELLSKDI